MILTTINASALGDVSTNGLPVEIFSPQDTLAVRDLHGDITGGAFSHGTPLKLTGRDIVFNFENTSAKYFEAIAPDGTKGFFAGSYLRVK
jgi:hypothetical protein